MKRALLLTFVLCAGCKSTPPMAEVTLRGAQAERVETTNASGDPVGNVAGTVEFHAVSPGRSEPTDILLTYLDFDYLYGSVSCQPQRATSDVGIERAFPMHLEPGEERSALIDFVLSDPNRSGDCGAPDQLEIGVSYYDALADDYFHFGEANVNTKVDLDIEPILPEASDWSCVGSVPPPSFAPGESRGIVWVRAFSSLDIVVGATVRVCSLSDPTCATPIDEGTTDIIGVWPLTVPTSGPYYFEVSGIPGMATSLFFEHVPPGAPGFEVTLTPFPQLYLDQVLASLGATPQMDRGHLAVYAKDCKGDPGEGVQFEIDGLSAGVTESYWDAGVPAAQATETTADAFGFFANAFAAPTTVSARTDPASEPFGPRLVHVRPGAVSFLLIDPTPDPI